MMSVQFGQRERATQQSHRTPGSNQQAGCVLLLHRDTRGVSSCARRAASHRSGAVNSLASGSRQEALPHKTRGLHFAASHPVGSQAAKPKHEAKGQEVCTPQPGDVCKHEPQCKNTTHARHLDGRTAAQTTTPTYFTRQLLLRSQQASRGGPPPMTGAHPTVSFPAHHKRTPNPPGHRPGMPRQPQGRPVDDLRTHTCTLTARATLLQSRRLTGRAEQAAPPGTQALLQDTRVPHDRPYSLLQAARQRRTTRMMGPASLADPITVIRPAPPPSQRSQPVHGLHLVAARAVDRVLLCV